MLFFAMISGTIKCWQTRSKKVMMNEELSTVYGAVNILLSHVTKVLSASSAKILLQL